MDLFDRSTVEAVRPKPERRASLEQHARELAGLPAEWQAFRWERVGDRPAPFVILVEGAIPTRFKQRGRWKGEPDWRAPKERRQKVALPEAAHEAWRQEWQRTTGLCVECEGTGRTWRYAGEEGVFYRTCRPCGGTGNSSVVGRVLEASDA